MTNPKTRPAAARRPSQPAAPTPRRVTGWGLVAAAVVLVAGLVLVATRLGGDDQGAAGQLEHVHGLGVDPADGALYAGSHYGLYRVPRDGTLEGPITDRVQDFMGFTAAGPGHFLASGHPGEGQDGPGALGLIESTDAGKTWTSRSLAGQADFHALEYRHDTVYGFNGMSGEFMVSTDMKTWETRAAVPMADFAVSPTDADTILATTEPGPALSTDGGRTFQPVDGAPVLLLVSWADDGTLVGLDPTGIVYVGSDGPTSLTKTGTLGGQPEALDAENKTTIYAAADDGLMASTDGGKTFSPYPAN